MVYYAVVRGDRVATSTIMATPREAARLWLKVCGHDVSADASAGGIRDLFTEQASHLQPPAYLCEVDGRGTEVCRIHDSEIK